MFAEHLSGLSRHFMSGLALVRLLAEGRHVNVPAAAFQEAKGTDWAVLEKELQEALQGTAAAEAIQGGMVSPQVRRDTQIQPSRVATRTTAAQVDLVSSPRPPRPPSTDMSAGPINARRSEPAAPALAEATSQPSRPPLPQKPWGVKAPSPLERGQKQALEEQLQQQSRSRPHQQQQQQQRKSELPGQRRKTKKKLSQSPRPEPDSALTSPGRSSNATPEVRSAMPRSASHKLPFTVEEDPFLSELKLLREKARRLPAQRARSPEPRTELVSLPRLFPPKSSQSSKAAPKPVRSRDPASAILPLPSQLHLPRGV